MSKRRVNRAVSPPSTSLFSAPAPSQSRSRLYTHAYSQPLVQIRGRHSQSRSQSPWADEGDNDDDDDSDRGETISQSSYRSSDSRNDFALETHDVKFREPSHRRLHLQRIFDLLNLSIGRRDGVRAFRCLRILLKSHEWRPIELWRYALEITTIITRGDDQLEQDGVPFQKHLARKRLAFLREVSKARTGLQLDVFIEIVPELLALGEEQQALAELDIVLHQYPYRLEPILHLYSALIFLKLSSPSVEGEDISTVQYTMKGVSEFDQMIAFVPHNLLYLRDKGDQTSQSILKEAERKFETVLNVGKMQSKRGRRDVARSRSMSRSRSRSKSLSRSRSRSRSRARGVKRNREGSLSDHAEEEEGGNRMMTDDEDGERPIEIGNDDWARNMARAYLEVVSLTRSYARVWADNAMFTAASATTSTNTSPR